MHDIRLRDYLILAVMPLFFVSNLIIGRPAVEIVPPSTLAASSISSPTFCRAARKSSMNVPEVVKTARMISTHIATDGPESQSHQVSPSGPSPAIGPASATPTSPRSLCSTPLGSANQFGPLAPNQEITAFTAPLALNRKMNTVVMATDGQDGWEKFEQAETPFDVVLTDLTMPRLGGMQLGERIFNSGRKVAVLLMTAYAATLDPEQLRRAGFAALVSKPLDLEQLKQLIAAARSRRKA